MGNLISHAKKEFLAAGYKPVDECEDGPNKWIQENLVELLEVFGRQGHSGSSALYCIDMFAKLAAFKPLGPLTGEDSEWTDVGGGALQNNRCSEVFKDQTTGTCYTINAYVFWHWSERGLDEDEDGYPGVRKYKSCFGSGHSCKQVTFPYTPVDPEYVEVECYEVNKGSGEREPGSGWWHTVYPAHIEENRASLDAALGKENL